MRHIKSYLESAKKISKTIKVMRLACNWSQTELARRAGITNAALHHIEKGRCNPSLLSAKKISDALGISLDALFGGYEYNTSSVVNFFREYGYIYNLDKKDQELIKALVKRLSK